MTLNVIIIMLSTALFMLTVAFVVGKAFNQFIESDKKKVEKKLQQHLEKTAINSEK